MKNRRCDAASAAPQPGDGVIGGRGGRRHPSSHRSRSGASRSQADCGAGAHRPRRRAGRGAGAGRAAWPRSSSGRETGIPDNPGRLAHGDRQAPRDRSRPPRRACSTASTSELGHAAGRREPGTAPDLERRARRRHRRRPAAPGVHRLPPGAHRPRRASRSRCACSAASPPTRSRARSWCPSRPSPSASCARSRRWPKAQVPVRGAARRRARRRGCRRCSRSST